MTLTLSPPWYLAMIVVSEPGDVTAWPLTAVMTSPAPSPAEAAALPQSTLSMSAPELAGAIVVGTELDVLVVTQLWLPLPPPNPPSWPACCWACCCGLELLLWGTSTPRKPGRPIWIVELP